MALPVMSGLRSTGPAPVETGSDVVVVMATPLADAPGQTCIATLNPPEVGRKREENAPAASAPHTSEGE
jgi:hypothetical protein